MAALPHAIRDYIHHWMEDQYTFAYILLDREGVVLDWGGTPERLGLPPLAPARPIEDQLLFTQGLFPFQARTLYLPMIKSGGSQSIDVHLFQIQEGCCLFLVDVTQKEEIIVDWQQKANETALALALSERRRAKQTETGATDGLAMQLLEAMDFVGFRLTEDGQLWPLAAIPEWWTRIFPSLTADKPLAFEGDDRFSFLANFLIEAKPFWADGKIGYIKSGIWIENTKRDEEHFFEAFAVVTESAPLLIVAHDLNLFRERQAIIQKGRELAMDHGRLERVQGQMSTTQLVLEEKVHKRTHQLQQANAQLAMELQRRKHLEHERHEILLQLQQTQKMEAIGNLAGGIAHDFNNILAAILGYTELSLNQTMDNETVHRHLEQVMQAAHRARDLIRQILTFSRRSKPQRIPISLKTIVQEALKLMRASMPAQIEIKHLLECNATIIADPTQIHQVIMNLCTNAMQAMQPDGGTLTVDLRDRHISADEVSGFTDLCPGRYLELRIKDTGQGMTPDVIQRMYDPFFTTKEKGGGTGLGLSVVHGIVKDCQGDICVQSQPGIGSLFTILLPVAENRAACEVAGDANRVETGRESILFIDDEILQVDLARQMLGNLGYQVVATTDCEEALSMMVDEPNRFDLVITDLSMPKMSGRDLCRHIREVRPDIPTILCSGYGSGSEVKNGQTPHVDMRLAKPFSVKEISTAVRRLLDKRQGASLNKA